MKNILKYPYYGNKYKERILLNQHYFTDIGFITWKHGNISDIFNILTGFDAPERRFYDI